MIPGVYNRWFALGARLRDCPFAQPLADADGKIGHSFARQYAEDSGARLDRGRALIPGFDQLGCSDFSPVAVDPLIRDFYRDTTAFNISARGGWRFPFNLTRRLYGLVAERIEQLVVPDLEPGLEYEMKSQFWLVDHDHDGEYDFRLWVREMKATGEVFYVAGIFDFVLDGYAYLVVAFPLWRTNLAVVLRCQNLSGGGLSLSTDGGPARWAGTYVVAPLSSGRFSMVRLLGGHEVFSFAPRRAGTTYYVEGTHVARAFGRDALVLRYCLARSEAMSAVRPHFLDTMTGP